MLGVLAGICFGRFGRICVRAMVSDGEESAPVVCDVCGCLVTGDAATVCDWDEMSTVFVVCDACLNDDVDGW